MHFWVQVETLAPQPVQLTDSAPGTTLRHGRDHDDRGFDLGRLCQAAAGPGLPAVPADVPPTKKRRHPRRGHEARLTKRWRLRISRRELQEIESATSIGRRRRNRHMHRNSAAAPVAHAEISSEPPL